MEIAPFRIEKRTLDAAGVQVRTVPIDECDPKHVDPTVKVAYYAVESTAPYNIDQAEEDATSVAHAKPKKTTKRKKKDSSWAQARLGIEAIARDLHRIKTDPTIAQEPELVISVHGYNTSAEDNQARCNGIFKYVAKEDAQMKPRRNLVFIGYRWPSENILHGLFQLRTNLSALPNVPRMLLAAGALLLGFYFFGMLADVAQVVRDVLPEKVLDFGPVKWFAENILDTVGTFPAWPITQLAGESTLLSAFLQVAALLVINLVIGAAIFITMFVLSLWILRIVVYFRDVYRAINFGVPDLTDLIRRIDQALADLEENSNSASYAVPIDAMRESDDTSQLSAGRVRLSFLGHSMGALVVTNTVRVLSDVFDASSIEQKPTANIGRMLRLSHLVLASPDIPVLAVVSSRANGLASSLRRFDEAYLFSNEGDLALRVASTAANYISFPSVRHNHHGHRLGSIAIRNDDYDKGIINLDALKEHYPPNKPLNVAIQDDDLDILKCLYITHQSGKKKKGYQSLETLYDMEHKGRTDATVSDLFTFFDCTDYKDYRLLLSPSGTHQRNPKDRTVGLLARPSRKKRKFLSIKDYLDILWDTWRNGLNVHGGYFQGEFTRKLMYRLVFLGFEETLEAIANEAPMNNESRKADAYEALGKLHAHCMEKGIQVYLSPLRYRVDVQKANIRAAKAEMLTVVQDAGAETAIAADAAGIETDCHPNTQSLSSEASKVGVSLSS